MIGTTHFLNALIEQRGLAPTAALRLGLPATAALPASCRDAAARPSCLAGDVFPQGAGDGVVDFAGHPAGWKEPNQHGLAAISFTAPNAGLTACTVCHVGFGPVAGAFIIISLENYLAQLGGRFGVPTGMMGGPPAAASGEAFRIDGEPLVPD